MEVGYRAVVWRSARVWLCQTNWAAGRWGGAVGVPQDIMRALCAAIWPDHFKFASYGPVL